MSCIMLPNDLFKNSQRGYQEAVMVTIALPLAQTGGNHLSFTAVETLRFAQGDRLKGQLLEFFFYRSVNCILIYRIA
jgi:hypothetical protein